jgi:hypothetical protein
MKHEYFRGLASDDVKFRLDRVHEFATAILDLLGLDPTVINAVDVGAGKGIWSHMLVARSLRSVSVIEPNDTCVGKRLRPRKTR